MINMKTFLYDSDSHLHTPAKERIVSKLELHQHADIDKLYRHHHGWLFHWLRRQIGCAHSAADLAQDTYVRLISSNRIPTSDHARRYLVQIAKGLVIDRFRRQKIEQAYLDALSLRDEQTGISAEEQLLVMEALVSIDAMLFGLKPAIRETFLLSRFDGLTYSDIAQQLNISVATVRKNMLIAMQGCINITTH